VEGVPAVSWPNFSPNVEIVMVDSLKPGETLRGHARPNCCPGDLKGSDIDPRQMSQLVIVFFKNSARPAPLDLQSRPAFFPVP